MNFHVRIVKYRYFNSFPCCILAENENGKNFVICVYTYDHTDEADVMRVRQRLKELGYTRKLPYKTDAATYAGLYRATTGGRVSKYYC